MQETEETWIQFLGQEEPLEEKMTTLSSILACEVPWTEEHGGLRSIASQRVWTLSNWARNELEKNIN